MCVWGGGGEKGVLGKGREGGVCGWVVVREMGWVQVGVSPRQKDRTSLSCVKQLIKFCVNHTGVTAGNRAPDPLISDCVTSPF